MIPSHTFLNHFSPPISLNIKAFGWGEKMLDILKRQSDKDADAPDMHQLLQSLTPVYVKLRHERDSQLQLGRIASRRVRRTHRDRARLPLSPTNVLDISFMLSLPLPRAMFSGKDVEWSPRDRASGLVIMPPEGSHAKFRANL